MKKVFLLTLLFALITSLGFSQADSYWSANTASRSSILPDKAVARLAYPKLFKLFNLNIDPLRAQLFSIVDASTKRSTIISLPNADGVIEQFEVWEASNFVPELQAAYPQIRAYSGKGITDKYATLKLSISPQGISTMVFRTEKENEFMEPYSKDHAVYSVYKSQREKNKLPWVCSTVDTQLANDLNSKVNGSNNPANSDGILRTVRLAQSVNGEYSNYFGAFNSGQSALVYAAINATLTRCNGCYEKDLALHLNLISNAFENLIIFYDPATDPYTTLPNWNAQLQNLLNTVVGDANYDIGHMFGASGGGGNAGCIGCVCVNGQKGSGITSPADGIPMGDNFDIDYVVHEVGHQLGGNHSFTFSNEGTVAQKEVGAGITIMGYAGITAYDPAPHSIDIYTAANIAQIQANLAAKACPTTFTMVVNHAPVILPVPNYTIPMQTPFALTGSATDPEGDPITYCWEQNDLGNAFTAANSVAFPGKTGGPNFLTFSPTVSPTRLFPKLSTILAGLQITPPLPGGDAICNIEALSNIARTETFRLTVRDNSPYVPGVKIGQTSFTDMTLTITNAAGPFAVTAPNTNVSWAGGSSQNVTWSVNSTNVAPVSCATVKISLSTDGGQTFPTVLAAAAPNTGTATITVPSTPTTTARIKVEAIGNVFFDIDDANFTITAPTTTSDLGITKTDGTGTYTPGGTTTYTIVATNAGPDPVTGATVADNFPAGITTINWTAVYAGGASGPANGSGNINATVNIPSGGTCTFTAVCNISGAASGNLVNTATVAVPAGVSDPNGANNSATDTDTQANTADLSITKTDGTTVYTAGGTTTYTIVASNAGSSAANPTTVVDNFPAAITSVAWTAVYAGGASGPASGAGNINATTINLPVGGTATFTAVCNISGAATGNLVNTATVSSALTDPNPANNSATDTDSPPLAACGNWVASTVYPITVLDEAVTSVGSNLYVFGGVGTAGGANQTVSNKFDGTTWTAIAPLTVPTEYAAAVSNGTDCYILGGANAAGTALNTLIRYNVGANTYTTLAPFTTATWNQTAVFLGGKIYKFGGTTAANTSTAVLEIYDIAGNTWSAGAPLPLAGSFMGGFTDGVNIYACGGVDVVSAVVSAKTYKYTIATNTWDDASIADLPAGRWGPAYGSFNSGGLLAGGYVGGLTTANISTSAILWNPGTNAWVPLNNMLGERGRTNGASINSSYYLIGGRSVASAGFVGTNDNQKLTCGGPAALSPGTTTITAESCAPPNNAIDPGEVVTVNFCLTNTGGSNTTNLVGTLQNTGGVTGASGPQNYGVVIAGGAPVCRPFTFTGNGVCGGTITATIQLQDGATNLGTVTYILRLGALNTVTILSQNFDGVAAPALPAGWTAVTNINGAGTTPWATVNTASVSAPNSAFTNDPGAVSDEWLNSPSMAIPAGGGTLTFQNRYNLESTFDGMVLEISIAGGAFTDIITAGGTFTAGGYNGTISVNFSSPILGRQAWTGASAGYPGFITTTVTLPAAANGQNIVLRWRRATDTSVAATGSGIDDVSVTASTYVCCNTAVVADLAITKTDGVTTYTPGGSTTYTIVASNAGPSPIVGATVTDNFPAGISSVNWTAVYAGGASGPASGSGNIAATVNIPVGGTATFTAVCVIASATTGNLVNTATVAGPVGSTDPTPGNNSATDTDTQVPAPCVENFDALTVPNLPGGWTATSGVVNAASFKWATVNVGSSSAPNSAFTNDPGSISDEYMNSRTYAIPAGGAIIGFKNSYNTEASGGNFYDGMVLEISINGGAFADIITSGGSFVSGGYVGTISGAFGSPIAGRQAWSGNSGGYVNTVVNLPAAALGQNVVFRWRRASDNSVGITGVNVDDVYVIPSATISYAGSPYCANAGTATVTRTGAAGGTYSSTAGLTLNAATGDVTLGTSTPGTYTVTYTIAASGGCPAFTTTAPITINAGPSATIVYAANPYCTSSGTATVTRTGTAGGTYSSTAGLTLNAANGDVTLATSTPGTYTVTYTIAASGGCAQFTTTTTISIYDCNCKENFDGVTAPALPVGWTATSNVVNASSNKWATTNTTSTSAPNSATTNDPGSISDEVLDSKTYGIITSTAQLTFQNNYNTEGGWDGMVLELSVNGGPFVDIITAGGSFVAGGYNVTLNASGNPLGGRQAWSGSSGGFITTTVNLPAAVNGQNVKFRWRRGSDGSVAGSGVWIDDIVVIGSNCIPACVLTCPANIVKSNDLNQCGAVVTYPATTSTGFCGAITSSPASGSFFPIGTTTVTSTSASGATCTFTVKVNDTQAPVVTCPANIVRGNDPNVCGAVVNFTPTATDNCPGTTIVSVPPSGSFFPVGTTTVTVTATDASGNTATCQFTVKINDTQGPTINCQTTDIVVSNDPNQCSATVFYPTPAVSDNCPGAIVVTVVPPSGTVFPVGTTVVTVTATDAAGNVSTCSFKVRVVDTQFPVVTCPANIVVSNTAGQCGAIVNFTPTATDNCPGVTVTSNPPSGSFFPVGVTTVTVTAKDASNNVKTCTFTVTVNDTQLPTVICPANISTPAAAGQCGAIVVYPGPQVSDNCPGYTVTSTPASGSFFPVGITTVTVTATDASGNTATCQFTVRVVDTQLPVITCPANIIVSNTAGQCGAIVNFTPTATDNCPGVVVTSSPASGSFFPVGTTTVTSTATDASGNIKTCQFTVRVNDTQAPVITCPANIIVSNTVGQCGAIVTYAPTATDNCTTVTVTTSPASGSFFPVGTTTVTATATDAAGNTATCTFTVKVNDTQLPTIVCPANITVVNTTDQCGAIVNYPAPTFTDNCPGGTVTSSPASGTFFPVGTTTVTATATDAAGNVSTCTFTVTVNDTQLPVITCPANIVVNPPVGTCTAVVNYTATVTDNCPGAVITVIAGLPSGSTFPTGVTTVTLQATDASGNTATCSFTVTVNDAQLPVITTQPLPRSACVNDNITFTAVATNAVSYQWQLSTNGGATWTNIVNGAPYSGATTASLSINPVTFAMNGFQYRLLVVGLCRTTTSNAVTLSVSNPPTIVLSAYPLTVLQPGDVTTLTAVTAPATGGSLVWKKDGVVQPFTGRVLPITVNGIGVWTVTYTDVFGCSVTGTITILPKTTDKLFVYPSPNDGHFHVRINIQVAQYMTLRVFDAVGKIVYNYFFNNAVPFFDVQVDLHQYSAGPYFVELLDENGKKVARKEIIIAR